MIPVGSPKSSKAQGTNADQADGISSSSDALGALRLLYAIQPGPLVLRADSLLAEHLLGQDADQRHHDPGNMQQYACVGFFLVSAGFIALITARVMSYLVVEERRREWIPSMGDFSSVPLQPP
jgi:hypothetical protein